jgi:hypothetical protein
MPHIVMLGDSIFDNALYTEGGPDVISQVRELLPNRSCATLLAVDGSTTESILAQLQKLPSDATHLVLSVGGNDAILCSDILLKPLRSAANTLSELADVAETFERKYRNAVAACTKTGLPLTICTVYNGNFPDRQYQRLASAALTVFNDAILRVGFALGLTIIDLRLVCSSPDDYANPIEPSSHGGAKIARCIVASLSQDGMPGSRIIVPG